MEPAVRGESSLSGVSLSLTDIYRCLSSGLCPKQSCADAASLIYSSVCGQVQRPDAEVCSEAVWELTCVSLTLVRNTFHRVERGDLCADVLACWVEILRMLFEYMDLMSQLVLLLQAADKVVSHLAAKATSMSVFYHLRKSGTVSPIWEGRCMQVFSSSSPGPELDACLWSLTDVFKRLLQHGHEEMIGKLAGAFDCSVSALCVKMLPKHTEFSICSFDSNTSWGTTFCLLLELLEVLIKSSSVCAAAICLGSQRIPQAHSPALLRIISCCSDYFVKKRTLLFLKKVLLQKPGDDLSLGGVVLQSPSSDMSTLAQCVLRAVTDDWLHSVQVEPASFFGGARHIQEGEDPKPDGVMLRAVSLVLLKSLEHHVHMLCAGGVEGATEVRAYLHRLWVFLKCHGAPWTEVTHLCGFISMLFGDQDDDLVEAANTLLSIFFTYRSCSGLSDDAVLEAACGSGFNPHCHFVLLLQSISFDASILLDFLISSETCFLEYFVRYLKLLRGDWQGFTAACGGKSLFLPDAQSSQPTMEEFGSCVKDPPLSTAGLRLVDYDSSDESDEENAEDSQIKQVCCVMDIKEKPGTSEAVLGSHSSLKNTDRSSLLPLLQSEKTHSAVKCDTLDRALVCLSELQEVVTRLQAKKLFPYNPSSLLKLLSNVSDYYKHKC